MSFAAAVTICLRKYVRFSGRARRAEYWWFALFLLLGSVVAGTLDAALFGAAEVGRDGSAVVARSDGSLGTIFGLATILPALAVGWRRMHDTGRSGLFLLYPLIVMVGMGTLMGVAAGFGPLLQGDLGALLGGGIAIVAAIGLIVFFLSPLIVLWWLTRPSETGRNAYGPNPHEVSP